MSDTPRILGGRYEVGELIGRGGMAEVHLGHDTRLGRPVAIKILRSDLARDSSFLQRFRREAQASAGLNHANIVAVYDSGEDTFVESGGGHVDIPYIVMEYVDGQTLREMLNEERKLPADEACRVIMGVLSALEYSHSRGIVHRDIKPGNVMVTRGGSVKVMDFGIARALADVGATMTSAQAVVGTARYLSPEQAQGQSVDPRSDLYSAGCVLYELLCGRAPFVGEPVSLVYQHIGEQPQPPSLYEHTVTPQLDAVVLHSLEKNRDERYQTAGEFRSDVLAARSGQDISAAALASSRSSNDSTEVVNYTSKATAVTDQTAELDEDQATKRRGNGVLWGLAALVALASILGIGYLFTSKPSSAEKIAVPNVVDMTYDRAMAQIGQDFKVTKKEVASDKDEGVVVDQDPDAGTKAARGSDVTLSVSAGPNSVKVPDITGDTIEQAKSSLVAAGIDENRIKISPTKKDDTGVDAGRVAATDPKAGSSLAASKDITLFESSGKSTVPDDLVGKEQNDATAELYQAHLSVKVTEKVVSDSSQVGQVIEVPQAGRKVNNGTAVEIIVGKKGAATETQTVTEGPTQQPAPTTSSPAPPAPTASSTSTSTPPSPSSSQSSSSSSSLASAN